MNSPAHTDLIYHATDLNSLASHGSQTQHPAAVILIISIIRHNEYLMALSESQLMSLRAQLTIHLKTWLADRGLLCQLGMDNYVLTLSDPKHIGRITLACESLHRHFEAPILAEDQPVRLDVTVGAAHREGDLIVSQDHWQLGLHQATMALRHAMRLQLRYMIHDAALEQQAARYWHLSQQMDTALLQNQFRMVYQPYYDLATQRCNGVEALIRLRLPELGDVSPEEFIPICEQNGLILALSDWIFKRCARDLKDWLAHSDQHSMSLNVSALSLTDPAFVEVLARAISMWGIDAHQLIVELTETLPLGDLDTVIETLQSLRRAGVRVALDDFGTGYATLSNLIDLPIDQIKLDRTFISRMSKSERVCTVVMHTIRLARDLGLSIVAEGVEDERTAELLDKAGCHQIQGYVITTPLEAHQLASWMRSSLATDTP